MHVALGVCTFVAVVGVKVGLRMAASSGIERYIVPVLRASPRIAAISGIALVAIAALVLGILFVGPFVLEKIKKIKQCIETKYLFLTDASGKKFTINHNAKKDFDEIFKETLFSLNDMSIFQMQLERTIEQAMKEMNYSRAKGIDTFGSMFVAIKLNHAGSNKYEYVIIRQSDRQTTWERWKSFSIDENTLGEERGFCRETSGRTLCKIEKVNKILKKQALEL